MRLEPAPLENAFVRLEPLDDSHREEMRRLAREAELWEWTSVRGDGPGFDAGLTRCGRASPAAASSAMR